MQTIIFDLDGTLTDLWPIERETLAEMLITRNPFSKSKILKTIEGIKQSGQNSLWLIFNQASGTKMNRQEFCQQYDQIQKRMIEKNSYPKIKNLISIEDIKKIENDYRFALVTGSRKQEALYVLKRLEILDLFESDLIITSDMVPESKDTGKAFQIIKDKAGEGAIVIGDSESDKAGAQKTKLFYIIVDKNSPERTWSVLSVFKNLTLD